MTKTIKFIIYPEGTVRFRRGNKEQNDVIFNIINELCDMNDIQTEYVSGFFKEAEEIKLLVGDTIFCG